MNQQDPHLGEPHPPQPPKRSCGRAVGLGCAGLAALTILVIIIVTVSNGGSDNEGDSTSHSTGVEATKSSSSQAGDGTEKPESQSLVQEFKAYVNQHGSATEKTAVGHVTKVQGADSKNDILDSADVYTDYDGGVMGTNAGNGKLIASAFADWQASRGKDSKNGLVTVYDKNGEILSNGNY